MIIIYVLSVIILLVLVAAMFAGKNFTVSREIIIQKSPGEVFDYIRYLQNHRNFSKWTTKKPELLNDGRGKDGQPGYIQPWHNYEERAGIGELEIKDIIDNRELKLIHHYFKPVKGRGESVITVQPSLSAGSTVKWEYTGHSVYPMNLLTSLLNMDKIIGRDLELGLNNLNTVLTTN